MSHTIIPDGYRPLLSMYDTQKAIGTIKRQFADTLAATLQLHRVSAPLFLEASTGLNDDLNGYERKVTFDIKDTGTEAQVVQSLAKWKRQALKDYNFHVGKGLYTDMNAIRRDEELDNLHSIYVDQWDWEKVIRREDRTIDYLKQTVRAIVSAVCACEMNLHAQFPALYELPLHTPEVTFISSQELEDLYPDLTPKERENRFVKENGTTFLMQIGKKLRSTDENYLSLAENMLFEEFAYALDIDKSEVVEYIENDVQKLQPKDILERAKWTHFYVVCDEDKIVGCGAIGPYWGKVDESSLFTIFVLPEYHGQGIGRKIIDTLEKDEYFLRANRIEIPASITATPFYIKMGYTYKNGISVPDEEGLIRLEKHR